MPQRWQKNLTQSKPDENIGQKQTSTMRMGRKQPGGPAGNTNTGSTDAHTHTHSNARTRSGVRIIECMCVFPPFHPERSSTVPRYCLMLLEPLPSVFRGGKVVMWFLFLAGKRSLLRYDRQQHHRNDQGGPQRSRKAPEQEYRAKEGKKVEKCGRPGRVLLVHHHLPRVCELEW